MITGSYVMHLILSNFFFRKVRQFAILTTLSEKSQAQVMNDVFLLTGCACGGGSYGLPNSKKPSVC